MDDFILTPNCRILLSFLCDNDETFVGKDLIGCVGIKGIYPVLRSLCDKGLVEKKEPIVRNFTNKDGKVTQNEYKTYRITELGKNYVKEVLNKVLEQ